IAVIQDGLPVSVFNGEVRTACALDLSVFVVGREVVSCVGLHGDELTNASVSYAGAVEGDQQGAMSAMKVARIERERDTLLLFILPVEASVQNIEMEISVDHQIVSSR